MGGQMDSISDPLVLALTALTLRLSDHGSTNSADQFMYAALIASTELRDCLTLLVSCSDFGLESQRLEPRMRQFMVLTLGLWFSRDVLGWLRAMGLDKLGHTKNISTISRESSTDDYVYIKPSQGTEDGFIGVPTEVGHESNLLRWIHRFQSYIVYIIAGASIMSLATFIIMHARTPGSGIWWRSRPLCGRLTLGQAKAIDFFAGALMAPIILAALSFLWFSSARSSISINQGDRNQGVPLRALVEASSTSTGSYSPVKLKNLLKSGRLPLVYLGILTLVVALAGSFVANVLAYEAYDRGHQNAFFSLTSLSDDIIHQALFKLGSVNMDVTRHYNPYLFDNNQTSTFADQVTGLLTAMSLSNATERKATAPAYIGINATGDSLALDTSVRQLYDIDVYRLTLECNAIQPTSLVITQMSHQVGIIAPGFPSPAPAYASYFPGQTASLKTGWNDDYTYAAFDIGSIYVFLGYFTSFDRSTEQHNSSYGTAIPKVFNMSQSGFTGTQQISSTWGLNCTIFREYGSANLTRKDSNPEWKIEHPVFNSVKEPIRNLISDWQVALGWSAPGAVTPGIAPAMGILSTEDGIHVTNLDSFATNFLHASAELERIAYEVAATNATRAKNVTVAGVTNVQSYRMTYIPAILFASLLTICIAACLTAGLAWYSDHSLRAPRGRKLDGLRLASDLMVAFEDQRHELPKSSWNSDAVDEWGKGFRVYYKPWMEGTKASVRLDRV